MTVYFDLAAVRTTLVLSVLLTGCGDDGVASSAGDDAGGSLETGQPGTTTASTDGSGRTSTGGPPSSGSGTEDPSATTVDPGTGTTLWGGSGSGSSGDGEPVCGCALDEVQNADMFPGCQSYEPVCETLGVDKCQLGTPSCVPRDPAIVDCILTGLGEATPGAYRIRQDNIEVRNDRNLFIDASAVGVAFTCQTNFGTSCSGATMGPVDLADEAAACLELEAEHEKVACAWALFELGDPFACE